MMFKRLRYFYRNLKRRFRSLIGFDHCIRPNLDTDVLSLGSEGACWTVIPSILDSQSIVHLYGCGENISFDLALISDLGVEVHAFDPTPKCVAWIKSQNLPEKFKFYEFGISDENGHVLFERPQNPNHVSFRASSTEDRNNSRYVECEVRTFSSICETLGHKSVDLLKLDIEGLEYRVIEDILDSGIPVSQILVEFHHRWFPDGVKRTMQAISRISTSGYKIFSVSDNGEEFGFFKDIRV